MSVVLGEGMEDEEDFEFTANGKRKNTLITMLLGGNNEDDAFD